MLSAKRPTSNASPFESAAAGRNVDGYESALILPSTLRQIDQKELETFAGYHRRQTGQKYAVLFYQKDYGVTRRPGYFAN